MKVRVLHIFGRMQRGGAEMRTLEVLERLCPVECRADVCALSGLPGSLDPRVRALGGEVIPLPLDARFPGRFLRLLRHGDYDVVHSHVLFSSGAVLALAARARVPSRVAHFRTTHDGQRSTPRRLLQRAVMRYLIDRYATDIVACGEGSMDAVWRAGWRTDPRCRVIYNSIDAARFEVAAARDGIRAELGLPAAARVFVHIGNETPEKNHAKLVGIFAAIMRHEPSSWLLLAGEGTDRPGGVTLRTARSLGICDRVRALGVRDDVPRLLRAADVLLLPSKAEGLPGAVLEACAAGIPVLASDLPGVREVATRLPFVRHLPVAATDAEWAAAAATLPEDAERALLRDTAAGAFRASVFHVDRAVEAYRALWKLEPAGVLAHS